MNTTAAQERIQRYLGQLVAEGQERGAQVSVYQNGREVVNAAAGTLSTDSGAPRVECDTLIPIFSTLKGVMATAVHLLAERGQLEYDTPIAHYWPEFGANGKEGITVRHALTHAAGIPYTPETVTQEDLNDWDGMCRIIAGVAPEWPAGTKDFYHAHTFSWIIGGLIERVDGRRFQAFLDEEINQPLGTALYSGLPAELEPRVAWIEPAPEFTETLSPPPRPNAACICPAHEWINRSDARRLCHPGVNGISNARSLARHYAGLLPGGVDGVELLSPERVRIMTGARAPGDVSPDGEKARKGLGYQLGNGVAEMGNDPDAFGHMGHGGSIGFASPRHQLAVGIARNRFSHRSLALEIWKELAVQLDLK